MLELSGPVTEPGEGDLGHDGFSRDSGANMHFDMILVHAPSVYDFRNRDDVLFAYLSNSDGAHVSGIFEMPPVGIIALTQHLRRCGFDVEFFNVASQMLRHPEFDVEQFLLDADADYFAVDLHWLAHAHGSLELARLYKEIHPSAKTVFGGIASTYHHQELISYPQVDYVVRGYDTLHPLELLVSAQNRVDKLGQVPNLNWKRDGHVQINPMTHVPRDYTATVDWREVFTSDRKSTTPYNVVIPQAGCEYNCRWCGGSRYFFETYMGLKEPARAHKPAELVHAELKSIAEAHTAAHTVTMINFWHEYPELFAAATDVFVDNAIKHVHFSLHRLPTVEKGRRMAAPAKAVIELSPDSHEMKVARASGRGHYTMEQMEAFIDALIDDVYAFEIYFMLGLPEQTPESIWGTVDYCEHVLEKYAGKNVTPYVCPMLPFLDPGSEIFDHAEKWGYTIFHQSLEAHRKALVSLSWKNRLNYETRWLSREELVDISYDAVRKLTQLKAKYGCLPRGFAKNIVDLIDATVLLMKDIEAFEDMPDGRDGKSGLERDLRSRILDYNRAQFATVRSQQRPVDFGFTKEQWFDTEEAFEKVMAPTGR